MHPTLLECLKVSTFERCDNVGTNVETTLATTLWQRCRNVRALAGITKRKIVIVVWNFNVSCVWVDSLWSSASWIIYAKIISWDIAALFHSQWFLLGFGHSEPTRTSIFWRLYTISPPEIFLSLPQIRAERLKKENKNYHPLSNFIEEQINDPIPSISPSLNAPLPRKFCHCS